VSSVAAADSLYYNPRNERIYDTRRRSYLPAHPEDFLIKELENKKVVIVGEVHSNPCHHHVEFEIVKALKPDAIGLECFYRQHQIALDRFIFAHGDMGILKKETAWQQTWGFDLNFYAKLFNYAAKNKIRLVGLNVPYDVARLVGQSGLASLPLSLVALLPEMDLSVAKHKQAFLSAIGGDNSHGPEGGSSLDHFYEAQVLWDEYMAESAAKYISKYPQNTLLVIAGVGHIKGRVGMPDRVQKRTGQVPFVIVPQQVKWDDEFNLPDVAIPPGPDEAEWIWFTEPALA